MARTIIKNGTIIDGTGKSAFVGDVIIEDDRIADVRVSGNLKEGVETCGRDIFVASCEGEEISPQINPGPFQLSQIKPGPFQLSQIKPGPFQLPQIKSGPSQLPQIKPGSSQLPKINPGPFKLIDDEFPFGADRVIDATGLIVSPGFIDSHTHSDAYLVIEPDAPSKITQGITTEINGMCGGSIAPRYGEARLSSDWAAILGERLTWHSLGEYREVLAQAKPAVNTVQFIGHNTLRSSVVGYAGRAADELELEQMKYLLEEALDEGGYGLTTGLIYQPGKYATPEEVVELARIAAKRGGFYATHMRSESSRILEAIDEVIDLVMRTGIRAEISHLKTSGKKNWDKIDRVIETIGNAVTNGILLGSDRYPFCAAGTDLDVVFPDWAGEGAAKAECERLADPKTRQRIVDEINAQDRDWSTVMIGGTWHADNKRFSGKRVSECLSEPDLLGISPGEFVCNVLAKDGCKTGAFFFVMNERNLDRILAQPWIVPGSDASLRAPWGPLGADHPHPRAYATMPEFYRRLRQNPLLAESERTREKVIARMTSVPAKRFGLRDRGVIRPGAFADIVVWKEDEFAIKSTYVEPHRFTSGVKCVMVNGTIPYADGKFTGERGGRFIERS